MHTPIVRTSYSRCSLSGLRACFGASVVAQLAMIAVVVTLASTAFAGSIAEPDGEIAKPAPYIRVVDEDGGRTIRLQTTARKFVNPAGGPVLHLVAAVHIGDRSFYRTLQSSLDTKDVVLFEGVRPPGTGLFDPDAELTNEQRKDATLDRLRILSAALEHVNRRDGAYPRTLSELPAMLGDRAGPFIRDLAIDGWGHPIQYQIATRASEPREVVSVDLVSYGGDGRVDGEGFNADLRLSTLDRVDDESFEAWISATDGPEGQEAGIQQQLASALGLTFQLDEMDHSKPNWRSSDMSMDQLQKRMKESGADGAGLFGMLSGNSISGKIAGMMLGLIGSSKTIGTIVKVVMLDMLSQADQILASQPGEMGKLMDIILHDRNEVVLSDLRRILRTEPEHESIAVIYGGGHMPGLEEGVRALGYAPDGDVWLNAITVDTRNTGMSVAEVNMLRAQMRKSMQSAMQQAQPKKSKRAEPAGKAPAAAPAGKP